ncbi:hypothetical protein HG530_004445 [Fusarium avenaceum]|nr:hypothetical protein HG530_004445 [Fusarium avenaceum]
MVDVRTVKGQHVGQLLCQSGTSSFNTEDLNNLVQIVGIGSCRINTVDSQHLSESSTTGIEVPLCAAWIVLDCKQCTVIALSEPGSLGQESTLNTRDTTESKGIQKMGLQALEHDIILHSRAITIVFLVGTSLDGSNTDDLLIGVVVTEDDCQIGGIFLLDTLSNIVNLNLLIEQLLSVQSNTQKPSRLVGSGIDSFIRNHVFLGLLLSRKWCVEVHSHTGSLDVLGQVKNFLETRHTKSNVLGRHTSEMESVQCHLGSGLTNGLGSQNTNHFTRVHESTVPSVLELTQDVVESQLIQTVLLDNFLECKSGTEKSLEENGGVRSLPFLIEKAHGSSVTSQLVTEFVIVPKPIRRVGKIQTVFLFECTVRHVENSQLLLLNDHSIETILTVQELNNITQRISNRSIVARRKIFQSLDQSSLNVTCFGSLDRSINETFSASHGVEEELARGKTTKVRVLNETTSFGEGLKLVGSGHRCQASDFSLLLINMRLNLGNSGSIRNCVTNTNTVTVVQKPVSHNLLNTVQESHSSLRSQLVVTDMNDTTSSSTNALLCEKTVHKLTGLNQKTLIPKRGILVIVRTVKETDLLRDNHADKLLTSPTRTRLINSGLRNNTIPVGHPEHTVHDLFLGEEHISTAKLVGSSKRVLNNTHERTVLLRRDNV